MKKYSWFPVILLVLTLGLFGCGTTNKPQGTAGTVSDSPKNTPQEAQAQVVNVGETFTVPDMFEITFQNAEWADLIAYTNDSGFTTSNLSEYGGKVVMEQDEPDTSYLVIHASIKNIGTAVETIEGGVYPANISSKVKINDKYDLESYGAVIDSGLGFDSEIDPLKTDDVIFVVRVSDELKDQFENCEITLSIYEDDSDAYAEKPSYIYTATFQ